MSKFNSYNIDLRNVPEEGLLFEYDLDEVYFKKIDSPEVEKGNVKAVVKVNRKVNTYELNFTIDGTILIPCDRCLDSMEQAIHYKEKLKVKFGATFAEENDIVIVPESDGGINIAWFLYEFIVLNIPIKHVHAPGECNKMMVTKLKRHITRSKDDEDDNTDDDLSIDDVDAIPDSGDMDSRWDGLKNIIDEN